MNGGIRDFSGMGAKRHAEYVALRITKWVGSPQSLIVHTILFAGSFVLASFGIVAWERMLLVVTTIVSLEAIYLSIFIQMSLNNAASSIEAVEEDIDEIKEDVDEIQEDIDEIQEDVGEIQGDIDEIQETQDDMEEADAADAARKSAQQAALEEIKAGLSKLMREVEELS